MMKKWKLGLIVLVVVTMLPLFPKAAAIDWGAVVDFPEAWRDAPDAYAGDVTGDGKLTSLDARRAMRFAAAVGDPLIWQFFAADVNDDFFLEREDARILLRAALGSRSFESRAQENDLTSPPPDECVQPSGDGLCLRVSDDQPRVGETITATLSVSAAEGLKNGAFSLRYDPDFFALDGWDVLVPDALGGEAAALSPSDGILTTGVIFFTGIDQPELPLVSVRLRVKQEGVSELYFSVIDGDIYGIDEPSPLRQTVTGMPAVLANELISVTRPAASHPEWDRNNDGKITTFDARVLLREAVGLEKSRAGQRVTTSDARAALRLAVGLNR